jgi:hypothetical protein
MPANVAAAFTAAMRPRPSSLTPNSSSRNSGSRYASGMSAAPMKSQEKNWRLSVLI